MDGILEQIPVELNKASISSIITRRFSLIHLTVHHVSLLFFLVLFNTLLFDCSFAYRLPET